MAKITTKISKYCTKLSCFRDFWLTPQVITVHHSNVLNPMLAKYRVTQKNKTHANFIKSYKHQYNFKKLGRLQYQSFYHHSSKFHLIWLLCIKVMYCSNYAPNGRNSIGSKLADVTQNYHSLKLISLLRFLKFFAVFSAISLNIDEPKALNTTKI